MLHVLPYAIPKFGVAKVYLAFFYAHQGYI